MLEKLNQIIKNEIENHDNLMVKSDSDEMKFTNLMIIKNYISDQFLLKFEKNFYILIF